MHKKQDLQNQELTEEISVIRGFIQEMCKKQFHGSRQEMASVLGVPIRDLSKALDVDGARSGVAVFERAVKYCLQREISLDALLHDSVKEEDAPSGGMEDDQA